MVRLVEFIEQLFYGSIHAAVCAGDMRKIRKLLRMDAALVHARAHSLTPLHCAADSRQFDVLRHLIYMRADLNATDACGRTPLHYCAMQSWTEGAYRLLVNGAKPDIMSTVPFRVVRHATAQHAAHDEMVQGTALDVAIFLHDQEMAQLLRECGGHRMDEILNAHQQKKLVTD